MSKPTKPENLTEVKLPFEPTPQMTHELVMAEYNRLCSEVEYYQKESSACATYAIAGSAAVWAWIAANVQWESLNAGASLLPVVLNIALSIRWLAMQQAMGTIGRYLRQTEIHYLMLNHGWESTVQRKPSGEIKIRWLGNWGVYFFAVLLIVSVGVAWKISHPDSEDSASKREETQKAGEVIKAINKLSDALEALKKQPPPPEPAKP